jgi:hypothetical protein
MSCAAWVLGCAVRVLGRLGVSISEDSSDELEGLGFLCIEIFVELQLFLARRCFLGVSIIGDCSKGWIQA